MLDAGIFVIRTSPFIRPCALIDHHSFVLGSVLLALRLVYVGAEHILADSLFVNRQTVFVERNRIRVAVLLIVRAVALDRAFVSFRILFARRVVCKAIVCFLPRVYRAVSGPQRSL